MFDGASRATQLHQHLRERGQGDQPPAANTTLLPFGGSAVISQSLYDGNGRLKQIMDDNNNITAYDYDSLDRETTMTYHDGSTVARQYNEASDVTTLTDANGSEFDNTFDAIGRKTSCSITLATGVIGTTAQSFEYDGLSRTTFARDSVSTTHADVSLDYDSLGRVLEDSQTFGGNTRNATNSEFTSYPVTEQTYP
ncbi:MAG: RHS repeat protein, partial [Pirellulales bacterium]|nr:RHS repeat protein [Pirellulales bacterium]